MRLFRSGVARRAVNAPAVVSLAGVGAMSLSTIRQQSMFHASALEARDRVVQRPAVRAFSSESHGYSPDGVEGVVKEVLVEGNGDSPKKGDKLTMHYVGTLVDGTKFDSSRDRGDPFVFTIGVGQVIRGWDEGVITMKTGETARLLIGPDYGYGASGAGGVIPPNATLIFEVELIKIN